LLAPMTPHITAELWERRHPAEDVHRQTWPEPDPSMLVVDTVTMVVQVNGKVRDRLEVSPGIHEAEAERLALASPKVQEHLAGRELAKAVLVPGRLINLVTRKTA